MVLFWEVLLVSFWVVMRMVLNLLKRIILQTLTKEVQNLLFVSQLLDVIHILRLAMVLFLLILPLACLRWAAIQTSGSAINWQNIVLLLWCKAVTLVVFPCLLVM